MPRTVQYSVVVALIFSLLGYADETEPPIKVIEVTPSEGSVRESGAETPIRILFNRDPGVVSVHFDAARGSIPSAPDTIQADGPWRSFNLPQMYFVGVFPITVMWATGSHDFAYNFGSCSLRGEGVSKSCHSERSEESRNG